MDDKTTSVAETGLESRIQAISLQPSIRNADIKAAQLRDGDIKYIYS